MIFLKFGFLKWKLKIFIGNIYHVAPNGFWQISSILLRSHPKIKWRWKKHSYISQHQLQGTFEPPLDQDSKIMINTKEGTFFKYENVQRTSETFGRQPENEFSGVKSLLITIKKAFIKCKLEKALRKLKFHSAPCGTIWWQVNGAPTSSPLLLITFCSILFFVEWRRLILPAEILL